MAAGGSRAIVRRPAWAQRAESPLLGPAAAVLLGLAGGFFCLAAPPAAIARLVDPAWFGGHVPLALLVALAVGGLTWRGFALLDRMAARPLLLAPPRIADEAPACATAPAPPVRRADAHPDAPPRRPIFAVSDLGPPCDPVAPPPADADADDAGPPSLDAMLRRLEAGLARKALVQAGADATVSMLQRELRPAAGDLGAVVAQLQRRAAARR